MSLPLEFFENFEAGAKGAFDSETDTDKRLDFPHQRHLGGMMPARGAYCCRVDLGKSSADAYLEKAVSWDGFERRWGRLKLFVGADVQFGNDLDHVRLLQFYSSTATPEGRLVLARIDPLGIVLVADMEGESWNENNAHFKLPIGEWVCVEFEKYVDESDGYIGAVLPGVCRITSDRLDEGSITKFRLGALDQSGDVRGHVYFDEILVDEDRLWDDAGAYNGALSGGSLLFLKSGFAFLDAGEVEHVTLIDGGSGDCRVRVYDTEDPTMLPLGALRENLATLSANVTEQSRGLGFRCKRGCYVELSGTNPQALLRLGQVASDR